MNPESDYTKGWLPQTPVEYLTLGIGGPRVRYIRVGRGPVLVLLHTVRTQLDLFQRVIPKLADDFTVYAFDYPGFGWSEIVPGADYGEPTLRGHVARFIEQLDLRHVTLAGESMGATLALTAAAVLGSRVKQVVAFNTYDYLPGLERANLLASFIIKSVRAPIVGELFAAMENRVILKGILSGGVYDPKTLPASFIDELDHVGKRKGYSTVARAVYRSLPSYVAARSLYGSIGAPVTLVYGDHDWSRPADRKGALAKLISATPITLEETGHFSSLERPDEVARILLNTKSSSNANG